MRFRSGGRVTGGSADRWRRAREDALYQVAQGCGTQPAPRIDDIGGQVRGGSLYRPCAQGADQILARQDVRRGLWGTRRGYQGVRPGCSWILYRR